MSDQDELMQGADGQCELCKSKDNLSTFAVPPGDIVDSNQCALLCEACSNQLNNHTELNPNHWRCLGETMWSTVPAVQVLAYRILKKLSSEIWAQDLFDLLYLDDVTLAWAKAEQELTDMEPCQDSNGTILQAGDTVTLIKDLDVKGTGFTAKRGTSVKNISLTENPDHIEGRVNGVRIVLLSCYLKKSS